MEKKPPPPLTIVTPTYVSKQSLDKQLTNAMYFHMILDHNIAVQDYKRDMETRGHVRMRYEYRLAAMRQELADLEFVMSEVAALQGAPGLPSEEEQVAQATRASLFITAPQPTGCDECDELRGRIAETRKDLRDGQAVLGKLQEAYNAHNAAEHNRRSTDAPSSTEAPTRSLSKDSTQEEE
jgi:hypothetical protein